MAVLALLAAFFTSTLALQGLPKSTCSLGAPQEKLDTCLVNYIQAVIPTVAPAGLPEVGAKPLDPLALPKITVKLNSIAKGVVVLTDVVLEGLKDMKIKQIKSSFGDKNKLYLELIAVNKHLRIQGLFDKKLTVGTNPIVGKGDFKLTVKDVKTRVRIYSHVATKDGKNYVHVDNVKIKPKIGQLKVEKMKLALGDNQLEALVLETIEKFWPQIYHEVYPFAEPHIAEIVKTKINELMLNVPYLDLISV